MPHVNRSVFATLGRLLDQFPCVALIGARQVGKSTLIRKLLPTAAFFDLEDSVHFDMISQNPKLFLEDHDGPLIIDEAQLCPSLFNALRVQIDRNRSQNGQYLISGSSSPELLQNISESLAGRVATLELGTFQINEFMDQPTSPIYRHLYDQNMTKLLNVPLQTNRSNLYEKCLSGGYPDVVLNRATQHYTTTWFKNYIQTYVNRDIRRLFPTLKLEEFKRFTEMLAASSGQLINYSNFSRSLSISQPTARSYFDISEGTFIWRSLPAYESNLHRRTMKMPKGFLRDTGLITYLLHIYSVDQLLSHPNFGFIWESMISEQILNALSSLSIDFKAFHYRSRSQAEIDLILTGEFGCIPIEIKSGASLKSHQLFAIKSFIKAEKAPFGIVIYLGEKAYRIEENLIAIPAQCL